MQKVETVKHIQEQFPEISNARAWRLISISRTEKYHISKMKAKDKPVPEAITKVVSRRRYVRKKLIAKVIRLHPELGSSRICRVYVKHGFSLPSKPGKRIRSRKPEPLSNPLKKKIIAYRFYERCPCKWSQDSHI